VTWVHSALTYCACMTRGVTAFNLNCFQCAVCLTKLLLYNGKKRLARDNDSCCSCCKNTVCICSEWISRTLPCVRSPTNFAVVICQFRQRLRHSCLLSSTDRFTLMRDDRKWQLPVVRLDKFPRICSPRGHVSPPIFPWFWKFQIFFHSATWSFVGYTVRRCVTSLYPQA
jgi:hypothetical protein